MFELNQSNAAETSAPEVVMTREQKLQKKYDALQTRIAKDTETAAETLAELQGIALLASVDVGSVVTIKLGRKFSEEKDTTRYVSGTVTGVKEGEDGSKLYKVLHGEGFDADVATVTASQITVPQVVASTEANDQA